MKTVHIGLFGKSGAGKTTLANGLVQTANTQPHMIFERFSFATSLKQIAVDCFGWDGKTKDSRARKLLQVLGTEAGRAYNPNIWVDRCVQQVLEKEDEYARESRQSNLFSTTPHTVFCPVYDDCRFLNEYEAIKQQEYRLTVLLERPNNPAMLDNELDQHASEDVLPENHFDLIIKNEYSDVKLFQISAAKLIFHHLSSKLGV